MPARPQGRQTGKDERRASSCSHARGVPIHTTHPAGHMRAHAAPRTFPAHCGAQQYMCTFLQAGHTKRVIHYLNTSSTMHALRAAGGTIHAPRASLALFCRRSNCRPESCLATFLLPATLTRLSPFLHSLLRAQDMLEHSSDAISFVNLRCSSTIREGFYASVSGSSSCGMCARRPGNGAVLYPGYPPQADARHVRMPA